jgi:hypothetical protein
MNYLKLNIVSYSVKCVFCRLMHKEILCIPFLRSLRCCIQIFSNFRSESLVAILVANFCNDTIFTVMKMMNPICNTWTWQILESILITVNMVSLQKLATRMATKDSLLKLEKICIQHLRLLRNGMHNISLCISLQNTHLTE